MQPHTNENATACQRSISRQSARSSFAPSNHGVTPTGTSIHQSNQSPASPPTSHAAVPTHQTPPPAWIRPSQLQKQRSARTAGSNFSRARSVIYDGGSRHSMIHADAAIVSPMIQAGLPRRSEAPADNHITCREQLVSEQSHATRTHQHIP